MPYLPPPAIDPTTFPQPFLYDLPTIIRSIEERWNRSYPLVLYTPISKAVTPAVASDAGIGIGTDVLSGETGTTKFDQLWGETIDPNLTTWIQPQNSAGAASPVDPAVYGSAVELRARIKRSARKDELQKLGFDRIRDLIVTIPTSLLDDAGVTVQAGDRFTWNNELYEVIQWSPMGWFYNTSVKLHIVMNVQHARRGS